MTRIPNPYAPYLTIEEQLRERNMIRQAMLVPRPKRTRSQLFAAFHRTVQAVNRPRPSHARPQVQSRPSPPVQPAPIDPTVLKSGFLTRTSTILSATRSRSGLTVEECAERAGVPSTVIQRVEAGQLQDITLQDFIEVTLACGHVPLDLSVASLEDVREFKAELPDTELSPLPFDRWRTRREVRRVLEAARASSP